MGFPRHCGFIALGDKTGDIMSVDNFGDWRIKAVTTLASDIPEAYPGGPSHKLGTPIYLTSLTQHEDYNTVGFITPSAIAMAFNIAVESSKKAIQLRETLALKDVITPHGKGKTIAHENLAHLYNYFEYCMSSIIFSFQSIESFSNCEIVSPLNLTIKKKQAILSAYDIQRNLSTDDKIDKVLPIIFQVKTPKGTKIWDDFIELKNIRDSTIHLKSTKNVTQDSIDTESLFFHFFNNTPTLFPKSAYNIIAYFIINSNRSKPRWFLKLEDIFNDI